jgi:hypothetical protein
LSALHAANRAVRHSQPASTVSSAQAAGLARQDDEHGLRDFLGQMRVAHLPQADE